MYNNQIFDFYDVYDKLIYIFNIHFDSIFNTFYYI